MQRNRNIEILRAVACILIICVHARFPDPLGTYIVSFARIGVPVFLMISGYFFYDSRERMQSKAVYQLKKTVRWMLFSLAICVISNSVLQIISGNPPFAWLQVLDDRKLWMYFLLFNRAYWLCSIMYYFFMMIYVYGIMIIALRINVGKKCYYLIPVLLICNLVVSEMGHHSWFYVGNFLFTGIPFFLSGMLIKKIYRIQKNELLIMSALLGAALTTIETAVFGEAYLYFGSILLSVSLFYISINNSSTSKMRGIARFGTECSVFVFIVHCHVMDYVSLWDVYAVVKPFLVILISVLLAVIMALGRRIINHDYTK